MPASNAWSERIFSLIDVADIGIHVTSIHGIVTTNAEPTRIPGNLTQATDRQQGIAVFRVDQNATAFVELRGRTLFVPFENIVAIDRKAS